mmetsp:Transcript_42090/g.120351  ORF Transcript_42090/g.120351 Transcript_42090/m.120351 type:complete len:450 (-) Transcript_42090:68-1417(-)
MGDAESPVMAAKVLRNCRQPGARFALFTLTGVNLLNFADRYVASSVKSLLKEDLNLTDAQTALPMTGMAVVYMICALGFGLLVDRYHVDRRKVLAFGILLWSVATALGALSQNLWQLIFFRSLVGVGEAAYGVVAQPMLSDFFPVHERTMAFAMFNIAMPIGGALGYGIGGVLGSLCGWRIAFCAVGIPGIAVAASMGFLMDPVRGVNDSSAAADKPERGFLSSLWTILTNGHWMFATAGMIATVFAIGGLADWVESFLERYKGVDLAHAGIAVGAITALSGLVGNLLGAKVTLMAEPHRANAGFLVSALFMVPSAAFGCIMLNSPGDATTTYGVLLASEIFLWTYMSPMSNISITAIPVNLRSTSSGLQIFLCHVLGDVISPPIVGVISDTRHSLRDGMQITWIMIAVAGLFWFVGYMVLPPLGTAAIDNGEEDSSSESDHSEDSESK